MMVVAGPGSGKTRTLVAAVRAALDDAVDPRRILLVTFTRLAAAETMRRLGTVRGLTIGTFHGVCYQLVCAAWEELGFRGPEIELFDRIEQDRVIARVINTARRKPSKTAVHKALDHMGEHGTRPTGLEPAVGAVIDSYLQELKQANAIDYQTAAYLGLELASRHTPGWTHIFADEVQDLDRAQWAFFKHCKPERLFAVGDIDQLVYGWRGASVETMRWQVGEWGAGIAKLETNYRSGRRIVAAADRLIAHNQNRIAKVMIPHREDEGEVRVIDAQRFAPAVLGVMGDGVSVAVLARTHAVLSEAMAEMEACGLKPSLVGRQERILERPDVREAFAALCFAALPLSTSVCERALRAMGWSELDVITLMADAKGSGRTFWVVAAAQDELVRELEEDCQGLGLGERLEVVAALLGLRDGPGAAWDEVTRIVARFVGATAYASRTPAAFMAWLNARDLQDEVDTDHPLQAMTIHASKGLEFDQVFVYGFDEGVLPGRNRDADQLEEERRLAFVAATRARHGLTLVVGSEQPGNTGPSRFLAEMGLQCGS